jgi:uncharacterized protein YdaU (DUF1376 family)
MRLHGLWWWIDRWRKSTAYTDMTLEEQGAYRNLLDEAQLRGGPLPDNERILAKACGDALAWPRVRAAVLKRFVLGPDGWRNATLDEVLKESTGRALRQHRYRQRNAERNKQRNEQDNERPSPSPSPSPSPITTDQEQSTRRARRPVDAVEPPKIPVLIRLVHSVLDECPKLATPGQLGELAAETKQRAADAHLAYDALGIAEAIDQALAQRVAVVSRV